MNKIKSKTSANQILKRKYRISEHISVHWQQRKTLTVKTTATDCQNYFYSKSALRIKLIRSSFEEYRKHSQDLVKKFAQKGYNESNVRKQIEGVDHLDRSLLSKHCKPKRKDRILFPIIYNPVLPNIKEMINTGTS